MKAFNKQLNDDAKSDYEETATSDGRLEIGALSMATEWDYELVLQRIGFGKTQWLVLLISGLLTITSMGGIVSSSIIVIAAECEFKMSLGEKGVLIASSTAGIFMSTYFWGYVSDAIGRRNVLLKGTFASTFIQFLTMFFTNVWFYNLFNLLMGISIGCVSAALYAYLSEMTVAKHRAVIINYSTMFVSVTNIYVPAIAWVLLSANWVIPITDGYHIRPWRILILFCLLPGFVGALMLLFLPESPKFLLAQKRNKEAISAVAWICAYNTGRTLDSLLKSKVHRLKEDSFDIEVDNATSGISNILKHIWHSTALLFRKPHGVNFLISALVVFGLFFSSSGVQVWFPEIVNRLSSSVSRETLTVCGALVSSFQQQENDDLRAKILECDNSITDKTYVDNIIVGSAFLVGFILQGMLLNLLGRKTVLFTAIGIAILSGVLLHIITNATIQLFLFCLYILMPGLSISIILGALVDFIPTQLRGKAVSISLTFGRLGIITASNLMGMMLQPLCNTTFAILTCNMLIAAILVHFLPFQ